MAWWPGKIHLSVSQLQVVSYSLKNIPWGVLFSHNLKSKVKILFQNKSGKGSPI